jgi:hypothetical protein
LINPGTQVLSFLDDGLAGSARFDGRIHPISVDWLECAATARCASILEHHPESGNRTGLKIEYQALALAAAAADHDLGIGGLFLLAQHRVMMLRNAGNNPRFASAADTELA